MKRYLFIGLIVIAIGWFLSLDPFRHQPPEPNATIEDREVKVYTGTYSWSGMFRGETADAKSEAVDLVKGDPSTPANPEDQLTIRFKEGPASKSVTIVLWSVEDNKKIKSYKKTGQITVPSTPGKYVYQITADWKEGDGDFAFPIEVNER
ncbi:hypothetical protein ESP131_10905 [Exiguobacterium sp. U13-1]|uniref:YtkA-like domain-containing protein n=1 Tax=Exiguobacterium acetylicum TaxID=41170 RepID=A0ABX8G538_EXIAC|nr:MULTISPECIES: hypothetical protein [Exiguobacterium]AOT00740.1 hypothetical protein ESP131_10905 [Exiguobacterium sp. U13-1]QWB28685.1 hypothetical protein KKI46_08710 [Exiguobacterium acetylicum]